VVLQDASNGLKAFDLDGLPVLNAVLGEPTPKQRGIASAAAVSRITAKRFVGRVAVTVKNVRTNGKIFARRIQCQSEQHTTPIFFAETLAPDGASNTDVRFFLTPKFLNLT
jgi:hypothetical protein